MYGMPGNQFGAAIRVDDVSAVADLVKEAQVAGKPARKFFTNRKELKVGINGTFLVNLKSGELLDEEELQKDIEVGKLFTYAM